VELEVRSASKSRSRKTASRLSLGSKLRKYQVLLLMVLGIGLIGTAALVLMQSSPANAEAWKTEAITAAETAVRNAVREEFRTAFSGPEETRVEAQRGDRFFVSGWVDLIPEDGQTDRQLFSCIVYKNEAGDWTSENVSVIPQ
jgi:hypothetical protein